MNNDQEKRMREISQEVYQKMIKESQFSPSPVQFHVHNGLDSSQVQGENIDNTNFMIWGVATFNVSNVAVITNANILTTSTVLVSSTSQYASTLSISKAAGAVTISGGSSTDTVNYLIIF